MAPADREGPLHLEGEYPGITDNLRYFENLELPPCSRCGSSDTASVQVGVIPRTMLLSMLSRKFKLIPNGPKPGRCFCNDCDSFFG